MQLVDRARAGRIFLAGDAAHLNPPFGGHGLNTGIGDAVDLGWKLVAVLDGWGGPDLLDSYEAERRPVQQRVIEAAVANMRVLSTDLVFPRDRDTVARIYARGLALTGAGELTANPWGFLWKDDEGPLGEHLRATGRAAVPHLAGLLGDDAELLYEGSQEAMLAADLAYRVKDAAAYYIGRATDVEVPFHDAHAERDAEIERLRAALDG